VLGLEQEELAPNELISAILRAPVDVLWNGGIGTVVKASTESHDDAQDRGSDAIRVNADELRCAVVAEGGNLGLTQRARIQYARGGGRVNADFVDNSAGVNCSDHEVNLKVLLARAVQRGELDMAERDELLRAVTDDVVAHVLYGSFAQAQILSEEEHTSAGRLWAYDDLMDSLEEQGLLLRREIEALPTGEELAERSREGRGLERPELAVLVAYSKSWLTRELLEAPLVEDPLFAADLRSYFPPRVVERFGHLIEEHPLRRELAATLLANEVVDAMGATFVSRLTGERGVRPGDVVRAWRIAVAVTGAHARWDAIEHLDPSVGVAAHLELMAGVEWLVEVVTRHYLTVEDDVPLQETIERGREGFEQVARRLTDLGTDSWRSAHEERRVGLIDQGVPVALAREHAFQPAMVHAPDAIAVARTCELPVEEVARAFFLVEDRAELGWLERQIETLPVNGRMQRWAQQALRDDVLRLRRDLVHTALAGTDEGVPVLDALDAFFTARTPRCRRLGRFVRTLAQEGATDLAGLTLALRQVRALVDA
jgi:glutamate dehydrogenase